MITHAQIGAWLGADVVETLQVTRHLSEVHMLRLSDGRTVVVKARPAQDRLDGCAYVHRHLWRAGFPCPELIAGPTRFGALTLTAEAAVSPGVPGASHDTSPGASHDTSPGASSAGTTELPGAETFAALLAELIRKAPPVCDVPVLDPSPPWIRWHHDDGPLWPWPDDRDADLHAVPSWHDEVAQRVRERLARLDAPPVIGHCDFEAHNIWWRGTEPVAVHDWDSAVSEPEVVIVGVAAAMWPAGETTYAATLDQTAAFLDGYQHAAVRAWTADEVEAAWAAGLWVRLFNAKKAALDGLDWISRDEARERSRLAGLQPGRAVRPGGP